MAEDTAAAQLSRTDAVHGDGISKPDTSLFDGLPLRLEKYLAESGLSKKEMRRLLERGSLWFVDGESGERTPLSPTNLEKDDVFVFGNDKVINVDNNDVLLPLVDAQKVYVGIYKPKNIDTQLNELHIPSSNLAQLNRPSSMAAWISALSAKYGSQRLFPVGRLDKKTTGLMIVTNDGDLSFEMCQPGRLEKEYIVTTNVSPSVDQTAALLSGVDLADGPAHLKDIEVLSCTEEPGVQRVCADSSRGTGGSDITVGEHEAKRRKVENGKGGGRRVNLPPDQRPPKLVVTLRVSINIGRNRIVRRLLSHVGIPVLHLHRSKIGSLDLTSSLHLGSPGDDVMLTPEQVDRIWNELGGKERMYQRKVASLKEVAASMDPTFLSYQRLSTWLQQQGAAQL